MGKAAWAKLAGVAVCIAVVVGVGLSVGLSGARASQGSPAPQALRDSGRRPIAAPSPTVVKELLNLRTATSSTFQLSNGARRAEISAVPIHWQDAQGNWRNFDTSLVAGSASGSFTTKATPFGVNLLANPAGGAAASLSYGGYTIGFALSGASESGGTTSGSALTFPAIAGDASESYKIIPAGLEQSLVLSSAAAPNSFSCQVSHPGLTLKQDTRGTWGFYEPGTDTALMTLTDLLVYDSSKDASGSPAFCAGATMTVNPGSDASTLTYTVPRSWLDSPARAYPVTIDPMAFFTTWAPSIDTSVYSAQPGTSYGTATQLPVGHDASGYWRSLLYFNLSAIPSSAYVSSTDLELYKSYSGGSNAATHVGRMNEAFSGSSTWTSLGCSVNSFPASFATDLGTVTPGASGWQSFWQQNLDYTVQKWIAGTATNDGLCLWQDESGSQGAAYLAKYYSMEYSSGADAPYLYVEYDNQPTVSLKTDSNNYCMGNQVTATMTVNTPYYWAVNEEQLQVWGGGFSGSYHGRLAWFAFDPNATGADGVSWVTRQVAYGYLAYEASPGNTFGTKYITPDLADSAIYYGDGYWEVVWKFALNSASPQFTTQGNTFSTYYAMDPSYAITTSGAESYVSGWQNQTSGPTFDLKALPVSALSFTTTANSVWWNPSSGNDDSNGQGRGSVTLNWPASPGADGYYIELWDGYQYDQVGSTTTTSWSSAGKGIYPTDTQIAAIAG